MKRLIMAALALTATLSACSKSIDERFAEACEEQQAFGGNVASASAGACENGEYLSPRSKEQMVEIWHAYRDQMEFVEELKEEGRRLGYETD